MKKFYNIVKDSIKQTFKLLWSFKWYVVTYIIFWSFFYYCAVNEYLNPPKEDSLIWGSEAMGKSWQYASQENYLHFLEISFPYFFHELLLLFLIGTSNIRNHPLLAKLIFLSPVIIFILSIPTLILADIFQFNL